MTIVKNYLFNLIYQVVTLIIPLITVPYISRVLGSKGVGINAYTNSIIQYFILFGTIGIAIYGNRAIAYVRDDKEKLSRTFWGIFSLKLITTTVSYCAFLLFLNIVDYDHKIFLFQSILILAAAADISWLYMGMEDFKKTVMRNLFVRLVGVISIFIFVKTPSDLWKYILILTLSEFLGHLMLWINLNKTVTMVKLKWSDIKNHFIPSVSLFIPQIAIQIYVVLNKTMLGYLSNEQEVGFFDSSDKIIKIVLSVATAMGVVMLPRVSNTFAKGDMDQVNKYLYQSFDFVSYISIPLTFGLAGIAGGFTPWFFGPGFDKTTILITIICPIIVFIAWSNVLGIQYLMPLGKVRGYTISVCAGAVINFILNLLLIQHYQSIGTAIATLVAEFAVTAVQLYFVKQMIEVKKLFINQWQYLLSGFVMFLVTKFTGSYLGAGIITTMCQVLIGALLYVVLLFALKSEMNKRIFILGLKMLKRSRG